MRQDAGACCVEYSACETEDEDSFTLDGGDAGMSAQDDECQTKDHIIIEGK